MSTRNFKNDNSSGNIPEDFSLPSCSIEDVDRALFELFDKQLDFNYEHKTGTKRAPVIFATGERFAVLRRKKPLRDRSGALILPLISIMRKSVSQGPTMGAGTAQNGQMTIKKKLSEDDPQYQRLLNKNNFQNSDDLPSREAIIDGKFDDSEVRPLKNVKPGRIGSRRDNSSLNMANRRGKIQSSLSKNIYEVITIPPPKYYTATYEVTFWAQYTIQMNNMITALMSLYQSFSQRTFQLETPKGYWFVGYVGADLTPGDNFDDFSNDERLIRYSFDVTVPAYIIAPDYPGAQNTLRRYISAPEISFDAVITDKDFISDPSVGIPSTNPDDYLLDDMRTTDEPLPGQSIGATSSASSDSRGIFNKRKDEKIPRQDVSNERVGGATGDDNRTKVVELDRDPFTGKIVKTRLQVKTRTNRKGETVLRESLD